MKALWLEGLRPILTGVNRIRLWGVLLSILSACLVGRKTTSGANCITFFPEFSASVLGVSLPTKSATSLPSPEYVSLLGVHVSVFQGGPQGLILGDWCLNLLSE